MLTDEKIGNLIYMMNHEALYNNEEIEEEMRNMLQLPQITCQDCKFLGDRGIHCGKLNMFVTKNFYCKHGEKDEELKNN